MSHPPSPLAMPLPWDLVARDYAREITPAFELYARDAIELVGIKPGARILDVAAGPGTLSLLVARTAARVTAVDFSPSMIAELKARAAASGIDNVETRVGDGQALELADASFDAAFSMFGLMFFPDRGQGLRELHRVLVPGGRVAVSSWHPMTAIPLVAAVFAALREQMPDAPPSDAQLPLSTAEAMREELEAAGFRDVVVHSTVHAQQYTDPAAYSESMKRTFAPLVLLKNKLGEERFRPIGLAIDARIESVAGPGPGSIAMPAWIGVGTASGEKR